MNASKILLDRLKCEHSLHEFVLQAWPQIEGDKPFVDGWAIKAVCDHLEAAFKGYIEKQIINIPPRTGKTSIISVMWPAWCFILRPSIKFLFGSYAQRISLEHSRTCRMLIESDWYQSRWGDRVRLSKDQSTKGHFATTALGHRISTSVGAGGTGLGADVLVLDDPNDAADSKITLEATNDWWSRVWSTRSNPGSLRVQIIVQQRINEADVSGYIMKNDKNGEWVKLILPMEYDSKRKCKTIALPSTNGKVWEDPRKKDGELLSPNYLKAEDITKIKVALGRYNYAGQYGQSPNPPEGGIIQRTDFKIWTRKKLPPIKYILQSWDTALTDRTQSDHSACTTWGLFLDEDGIANMLLLYAWHDRLSYPNLLKRALRLQKNCADIGEIELEESVNNQPDVTVVEAKAAGHPLISDLVEKGILVKSFNPGEYGDKTFRVSIASPYIENGKVWVIGNNHDDLESDHEMLVSECVLFPKGESDDLVDTLSQAILFLVKKGMIKHTLDFKIEKQTFMKEQMPGYREK